MVNAQSHAEIMHQIFAEGRSFHVPKTQLRMVMAQSNQAHVEYLKKGREIIHEVFGRLGIGTRGKIDFHGSFRLGYVTFQVNKNTTDPQ